ncbi:MAG: HEAT repeat domain-containing protein [Candidatus Kapabacteria bacterium]|nr:HEAT repeat domain-containing protein [Candidatus Kapabacteria bacterium]
MIALDDLITEQLLDTFLTSNSVEERRAAVQNLARTPLTDDTVFDHISYGLADSDAGIRDACAFALLHNSSAESNRKAQSIAPHILHHDIQLRNTAGELLIKLGRSSLEAITPYLQSENYDVRKYVCDIIGLIGTEDDATLVIPLLNDADTNTRYSAIETLGNLHSNQSAGLLMGMYAFEEDARPFLIEALGKIGGDTAANFLLSILRYETDLMAQMTIIDALSLCAGQTYLAQHLIGISAEMPAELQPHIIKSAQLIAERAGGVLTVDDAIRSIIRSCILHGDEDERNAALRAFQPYYSPDDIPALVHAYYHSAAEIRCAIASAVCHYCDGESASRFVHVLTMHKNCSIELLAEFLNYLCMDSNTIENEAATAITRDMVLYFSNISTDLLLDFQPMLSRISMHAFITVIDELLSSGNDTVICETLNVVAACGLREIEPHVRHLCTRNDSVGELAHGVLETLA